MTAESAKKPARRVFWTVAPFYALVAFEFFYMASPIALYFYSIYRPGLGFLSAHPSLSWLGFFFLPHIVPETTSWLLDVSKWIGALLVLGGLLAFLVGAVHIYYYKLVRKGVVTGGVYNWIRHPQYTALAISSLGMLILWPRLLVLPLFLAVVFVYYFLARAEERECERKFGSSYTDYLKKTGMFLPFRMPRLGGSLPLQTTRGGRILTVIATFVVSVLLSLVAAQLVRGWTVDRLYTHYSEDAAYISLAALGPAPFAKLAEIAASDTRVQERLQEASGGQDTRFLNYVLPAGWYVSEIPMNPVEGAGGHHTPAASGPDYKIVFTRAVLRGRRNAAARGIVLNTVTTEPVMEVWVDLAHARVFRIAEPPEDVNYPGVSIPIF